MARDHAQQRRAVKFDALDRLAATMKLRSGVELPSAPGDNIPVPRTSFIPVVQADVGCSTSITAFCYRILVPFTYVIEESATTIHHVRVASDDDLKIIQRGLIRHFGGVTMRHQQMAPALGIGARDPADVSGTSEKKLHVSFEVYAAPVKESDDYFRALRRELEEALCEGVLLIERHEVTLI